MPQLHAIEQSALDAAIAQADFDLWIANSEQAVTHVKALLAERYAGLEVDPQQLRREARKMLLAEE
jgi:hypothetical protein